MKKRITKEDTKRFTDLSFRLQKKVLGRLGLFETTETRYYVGT